MNKSSAITLLIIAIQSVIPTVVLAQEEEEEEGDNISREIFIYSPNEREGLHAAYLDFEGNWQEMGQLCASDYGQWGVEKRMFYPNVVHASDGTWRAVWQLNDHTPSFAATYSADLITWRPQDYPKMTTPNCLRPIVFEGDDGSFDIFYQTGNERRYVLASKDFRTFSADTESSISDEAWGGDMATIGGKDYNGQIFDITQGELIALLTHFEVMRRDSEKSAERMENDAKLFDGISQAEATLSLDTNNKKAISDKLIGVFFEDISYAADGGLYAELVQNRDFEYSTADRRE